MGHQSILNVPECGIPDMNDPFNFNIYSDPRK